jgi:hypothetical protein
MLVSQPVEGSGCVVVQSGLHEADGIPALSALVAVPCARLIPSEHAGRPLIVMLVFGQRALADGASAHVADVEPEGLCYLLDAHQG